MRLNRSFKYRLYPTEAQAQRLDGWKDAQRFLWNLALEQRLLGVGRCWWSKRVYSAFDQIRQLTELRAAVEWLADVPAKAQVALLIDLDYAWQRGARGVTERPGFRKKNTDTSGIRFLDFRWESDGVVLSKKLGKIAAVIHRQTRGVEKSCTVSRDGDQWFVSVLCEIERDAPVPTGTPIGLDRGVVNTVVDSDGEMRASLDLMKPTEARLLRAQRRASRKKKGSRNSQKAQLIITRLYRKARRQRDAVLHCTSLHYAKNHSMVALERLNIPGMTASASGTAEEPGHNVSAKAALNRGILRSGWGRFARMLVYKAEWHGSRVVEVPAMFSSQTCSACSHVSALSRKSQSVFECVVCGNRLHADVNAAKVILSRGIHGGAVCGGSGISRPRKQKLRAARSRKGYGTGIGIGASNGSV